MGAARDEVFRALSDPTRRAIYERLMREGEQTVRALTDYAGVSQPAVSKHLALLKVAGLVHDRPAGRQVHYRADPAGLAPLAGRNLGGCPRFPCWKSGGSPLNACANPRSGVAGAHFSRTSTC